MLVYDEAAQMEQLSRLGVRGRTAFALLVAIRLLPGYRRFDEYTGRGDCEALEAAMAVLWNDLVQKDASEAELAACEERVMAAIPADDPWHDAQPYAEDAASALAYAVRTRRNADVQETAWAGRLAYEMLDTYIQRGVPGGSFDERLTDESPLVHAELTRQRTDIADLRVWEAEGSPVGRLQALRERAERDGPQLLEALERDLGLGAPESGRS